MVAEELVPGERPEILPGITRRVRTGHGNIFITVNFDRDNRLFEVFSTLGKAGSCDAAQLEAIGRLATLAVRAGIHPQRVIDELRGITCCPTWDEGVLVRSAPDAIALVMQRETDKRKIHYYWGG